MKNSKKINWRVGIVTTFAAAALTATLTSYAVWQEDVLTNYTYTNDTIAIDSSLFVGQTVTSTTAAGAVLTGESIFSIYTGIAEMDFIDSTNANDPSWSIGQVSNAGDFNITWRGDMDTTDGSAVVFQHVMALEDNSPVDSIQTFATGDVSLAAGDVYWDDSTTNFGLGKVRLSMIYILLTQIQSLGLTSLVAVPIGECSRVDLTLVLAITHQNH